MSWVATFLWDILMLLGLLILLAAFLAPFEALSSWGGATRGETLPHQEEFLDAVRKPRQASYFLVYLTGVLGFESGSGGDRETDLVEAIAAQLPEDAVIVTDVFPYSASNNPLNGERLFAAAWRWVDKRRSKLKSSVNLYNAIIVTRNVLQVAVSADPRYGPLNNLGVARQIALSLLRHGYPVGTGQPIYLVGYSGGGQVAVGAARYLNLAFAAPIRVVSLGGFFSDDPGVSYVDQIFDLQGTKDPLPMVGSILYPGRWPLLPYSQWNKAKRHARLHFIKSGPMTHFGETDYFSQSAQLDDGTSFAVRTAELAAACITQPIATSPITKSSTHKPSINKP